ncbi:hypothetical protein Q5Y75_01520 [Ruegeria sp. 2205SS24-7]|uniref:hypothetical protein n=1 Tax=Ruegeria discodermiae TaxID=3064389 RepID=UPI0027409634|nr:hypothetical protein [Ruegeria sp. 2205SS24-7]MDP5215888.1 hypothetical protein [Ruegeria sp. 2205SS24-7]
MHDMIAHKNTGLSLERGRTFLWSVLALGLGIALGAGIDGGAPDRFEPTPNTAQTLPAAEDWHGNVKSSNWSETR